MSKMDGPGVLHMPVEGLVRAPGVEVTCGELQGILLPGGRRGEERVQTRGGPAGPAELVAATEFERRAGRGSTKKWRCSLRVVEASHLNGKSVQDWLQAKGNEVGYKALGRALAVYWPEDDVLYKGHLKDFRHQTGEHKVLYADGESEWIHLVLQDVKWLDNEEPLTIARPAARAPSAPTNRPPPRGTPRPGGSGSGGGGSGAPGLASTPKTTPYHLHHARQHATPGSAAGASAAGAKRPRPGGAGEPLDALGVMPAALEQALARVEGEQVLEFAPAAIVIAVPRKLVSSRGKFVQSLSGGAWKRHCAAA